MTHGKALMVTRRSTRRGARLHMPFGCYWATRNLVPVGDPIALTKENADEMCRNCFAAVRAAINAAEEFNTKRAWSPVRARVETSLIVLKEVFQTPAQAESQAALVARWFVPLVVPAAEPIVIAAPAEPENLLDLIPAEPKRPVSAIGRILAGFGTVSPQLAARQRIAARRTYSHA